MWNPKDQGPNSVVKVMYYETPYIIIHHGNALWFFLCFDAPEGVTMSDSN